MASQISQPTSATTTVGAFSRDAFNAHLERVKHLPSWWLDRKRAAYKRFAALPMPKRTDEGWRFSNFGALSLEGYQAGLGTADEKQSAPPVGPIALTFVNNRCVASPA